MSDQDNNRQFHDLVWPHRALVLRLAHILTGNAADAEDLAQETLFKAFRSLHTFRPGTNMQAWLATILRNTRIDQLRAASAPAMSLGDLDAELPAAPEIPDPWSGREPQQILAAFSDQQIIDALQAIPEEIRWTLLLVDVEGWDHVDAAHLLGVPVGTIKSRAHRGRSMLRQALLPLTH